jgi:hypothetical protein
MDPNTDVGEREAAEKGDHDARTCSRAVERRRFIRSFTPEPARMMSEP